MCGGTDVPPRHEEIETEETQIEKEEGGTLVPPPLTLDYSFFVGGAPRSSAARVPVVSVIWPVRTFTLATL
jgi:hypothetical protein